MSEYKITIESDIFTGKYATAADAVFGSMRMWEAEHGSYSNIAIIIEVIEPEPCPKGFMRVDRACKDCGSKIRPRVLTRTSVVGGTYLKTKAGKCKHGVK